MASDNSSICILFTGGGTAGHVIPNIALIDTLQQKNPAAKIFYIGSHTGLEKPLITAKKIPYFAISTGKLRRYWSWQNLIDPFKIIWGGVKSLYYIKKIKPQIVFSKGGFVAVPVTFAARFWRIPVIVHESDYSPGLANRLCFPIANKIGVTFPETKKFIKHKEKVLHLGTPIRQQFFTAQKADAPLLNQFNDNKPLLLIVGGSLGAASINQVVRQVLPDLLKIFNIMHICGKGKLAAEYDHIPGYRQVEYVDEEMFALMRFADFVVARAGANLLFELLALKKPHLLIPLSAKSSRGDQIQNANYFAEKGVSAVLLEEQLNPENFYQALMTTFNHKDQFESALKKLNWQFDNERILALLFAKNM